MAKHHYPDEFRRKAVDLYESSPDSTMQTIANELGISRSALDAWVSRYGTGARISMSGIQQPSSEADESQEATIRRLRAELDAVKRESKRLATERDILRQAAKYFAGETNW